MITSRNIEYREHREKIIANQQTLNGKKGNEKWKITQAVLLKAAEDLRGKTKGGKHQERETWWRGNAVQNVIKRKRDAFKEWQRDRDNTELETKYKDAKKEAKREVAKAKEEATKEWYDNMESKEGERCMYRVARQRARRRKDVGDLKYVRDQQGEMLTEDKEVMNRWRKYFENLLNVDNEREDLPTVERTEGPIQNFSKEEIKRQSMR